MPEDVTGSSTYFTFNPRAILLGEFPTDLAPDMEPQIASGLVAQNARNQIRITQPRRTADSDGEATSEDVSQFFMVSPMEVERFLAVQRELGGDDVYDRWKLGAGVGVGVGVPLLMVASGFLGWLMGRKTASRRPEAIDLPSK